MLVLLPNCVHHLSLNADTAGLKVVVVIVDILVRDAHENGWKCGGPIFWLSVTVAGNLTFDSPLLLVELQCSKTVENLMEFTHNRT
jgi:hypothetical protein